MYKRRTVKPKRKVVRRRRRTAVPRAPRTGGFTITRQVPTLFLTNGSGSGNIQLNKTGILNVGAAVQHPIFTQIYDVPFAFEFSLADLSQYAELTGISDRYKITKVQVKCQYNAPAAYGAPIGGSAAFVPSIKYVTDVDDATPSTVGQMDAKMGVRKKTLNNGRYVTMTCKPRCSMIAFDNSQTQNAYSVPSKPQWINSGYPLVPHYGIKGYIENLPLDNVTVQTTCLTWVLTYTVQVRDLQ